MDIILNAKCDWTRFFIVFLICSHQKTIILSAVIIQNPDIPTYKKLDFLVHGIQMVLLFD